MGTEIYKSIHNLLGMISRTTLWGWLPLDMVLHFSLGALITIILRLRGKSALFAVVVVFLLEVTKEIFDSFSLTATWEEAIKDMIVTMFFPVMLLITIQVKRKLERSSRA